MTNWTVGSATTHATPARPSIGTAKGSAAATGARKGIRPVPPIHAVGEDGVSACGLRGMHRFPAPWPPNDTTDACPACLGATT